MQSADLCQVGVLPSETAPCFGTICRHPSLSVVTIALGFLHHTRNVGDVSNTAGVEARGNPAEQEESSSAGPLRSVQRLVTLRTGCSLRADAFYYPANLELWAGFHMQAWRSCPVTQSCTESDAGQCRTTDCTSGGRCLAQPWPEAFH